MTDRELLEAAAQAARMALTWDGDNPPYPRARSQDAPHWNPAWNPLASDGDALRLAVKLGLAVDCLVPTWHENKPTTMVLYGPRLEGRLTDRCHEKHNTDPGAATRRAIVRAAAEIGKATAQDRRSSVPSGSNKIDPEGNS